MAIWSKGVGFIVWFDLDSGSEMSLGYFLAKLSILGSWFLPLAKIKFFDLANKSKFILLPK
jgi:hypothetical protein